MRDQKRLQVTLTPVLSTPFLLPLDLAGMTECRESGVTPTRTSARRAAAACDTHRASRHPGTHRGDSRRPPHRRRREAQPCHTVTSRTSCSASIRRLSCSTPPPAPDATTRSSRRGNLVCIDSHAKDALWRAAVRREVSGSEFTESVRAITDPANGNAWWRLRAKEFFLDRVAAYCCGDHPEGESSVPTILVVPKRIVSPLQTTEGVA